MGPTQNIFECDLNCFCLQCVLLLTTDYMLLVYYLIDGNMIKPGDILLAEEKKV